MGYLNLVWQILCSLHPMHSVSLVSKCWSRKNFATAVESTEHSWIPTAIFSASFRLFFLLFHWNYILPNSCEAEGKNWKTTSIHELNSVLEHRWLIKIIFFLRNNQNCGRCWKQGVFTTKFCYNLKNAKWLMLTSWFNKHRYCKKNLRLSE